MQHAFSDGTHRPVERVSVKVFVRSLGCQITMVVVLAPHQIARGDSQWQYERAQKEGSAEAAPGGRKSKVIVFLVLYYTTILYKYQIHF